MKSEGICQWMSTPLLFYSLASQAGTANHTILHSHFIRHLIMLSWSRDKLLFAFAGYLQNWAPSANHHILYTFLFLENTTLNFKLFCRMNWKNPKTLYHHVYIVSNSYLRVYFRTFFPLSGPKCFPIFFWITKPVK